MSLIKPVALSLAPGTWHLARAPLLQQMSIMSHDNNIAMPFDAEDISGWRDHVDGKRNLGMSLVRGRNACL
jgi:hypothetical protein